MVLCTRRFCRPCWNRLLTTRKATDVGIVLVVDPVESSTNEDLDLPETSRIVKLANDVTYDRQVHPVSAWKVG